MAVTPPIAEDRRGDAATKCCPAIIVGPRQAGQRRQRIWDVWQTMLDHNAEPLSAAVLAGGKSSRMGTDKAMIPLVDGGAPMLRLVLDAVSSVADDILVVGERRPVDTGYPVRSVPDAIPGSAALGGIHAALVNAEHERCLVVACDMPFLDRNLLRAMVEEPRDYDVLIPVLPGQSRQRSDGTIYQTLHAIYAKSAIPAIERQLQAQSLKVIGFFDDVVVRTIGADAIARYDPEFRSFFNANSPEALAAARRIAAAQVQGY